MEIKSNVVSDFAYDNLFFDVDDPEDVGYTQQLLFDSLREQCEIEVDDSKKQSIFDLILRSRRDLGNAVCGLENAQLKYEAEINVSKGVMEEPIADSLLKKTESNMSMFVEAECHRWRLAYAENFASIVLGNAYAVESSSSENEEPPSASEDSEGEEEGSGEDEEYRGEQDDGEDGSGSECCNSGESSNESSDEGEEDGEERTENATQPIEEPLNLVPNNQTEGTNDDEQAQKRQRN